MNLLIAAARIYTPAPLRQKGLLGLFAATATAFECEAPSVTHLSHYAMLRAYARFTAEQAGAALELGTSLPELRGRLFASGCRQGTEWRRAFRIRDTAEALATAEVLYGALGISLRAAPLDASTAKVTVRRCLFSEYYSGDICQLIASLDAGLFAGLSRGGRLDFHQRITTGDVSCAASFHMQGGP